MLNLNIFIIELLTAPNVMNDPNRKTWKLIHSLLEKKTLNPGMLIDGISVSDPKSIAEELIDYFISISSRLATQ